MAFCSIRGLRLSTSDDHKKRFAAAGWHVQAVDGHDPEAVTRAIRKARKVEETEGELQELDAATIQRQRRQEDPGAARVRAGHQPEAG